MRQGRLTRSASLGVGVLFVAALVCATAPAPAAAAKKAGKAKAGKTKKPKPVADDDPVLDFAADVDAIVDKEAAALASRGRAALKAGELEKAAELLLEAYEKEAHASLLYDLGRVWQELGDRERVIFYFQAYLASAGAKAPHADEVKAALGRLGAGATSAATEAATPRVAAETGERLLAVFQREGVLSAAQWKRMKESFSLAGELEPANPKWAARAAFAEAGELFTAFAESSTPATRKRRLDGVLDDVRAKLDVTRLLDREWPPAAYLECYVLLESERGLEATDACSAASATAPGWALPLVSIGFLARRRGELDAAAAKFALASATAPEWAWPRYQLCYTLVQLERWTEAVKSCSAAAELDPGLSDAYLSLGVALQKLGKKDDALVAYKRAVMSDPFSRPALRNTCFLLVELEAAHEAEIVCRRGLEPDAEDAAMVEALGDAYFALERWTDARRAYLRALALDPKGEQIDPDHCAARLSRIEKEIKL